MLATVLLACVVLGVTLQVAMVVRVGGRIARPRLSQWHSTPRHPPHQPAEPSAAAHRLRRRCRDYRTALRAAKA
jgi:hypothetical protein